MYISLNGFAVKLWYPIFDTVRWITRNVRPDEG